MPLQLWLLLFCYLMPCSCLAILSVWLRLWLLLLSWLTAWLCALVLLRRGLPFEKRGNRGLASVIEESVALRG